MRRVQPLSWSSGPSDMMGYFTFGEAISFLGKPSNLVEKLHLISQIFLRANMQSLLNGVMVGCLERAGCMLIRARARFVWAFERRTERRSGVHFYLG